MRLCVHMYHQFRLRLMNFIYMYKKLEEICKRRFYFFSRSIHSVAVMPVSFLKVSVNVR